MPRKIADVKEKVAPRSELLVALALVWLFIGFLLAILLPMDRTLPREFAVSDAVPSIALLIVGIYAFVFLFSVLQKLTTRKLTIYLGSFALLVLLFNASDIVFEHPVGPDALGVQAISEQTSMNAHLSPGTMPYHQFPGIFLLSVGISETAGINYSSVGRLFGFLVSLTLLLTLVSISRREGRGSYLPVYTIFYFVLISYLVVFQYSPQIFAFALSLFLISTVIGKGYRPQYFAIFLILFLAVVITHPITPIFIMLFATVSVAFSKRRGSTGTTFNSLALMVVIFLSWFLFIAYQIFSSTMNDFVSSLELAFQGLYSSPFEEKVSIISRPTQDWTLPATRIFYLVFLAIIFTGFWLQLRQKRFGKKIQIPLIFACLALFVILFSFDVTSLDFADRPLMWAGFIIVIPLTLFFDKIRKESIEKKRLRGSRAFSPNIFSSRVLARWGHKSPLVVIVCLTIAVGLSLNVYTMNQNTVHVTTTSELSSYRFYIERQDGMTCLASGIGGEYIITFISPEGNAVPLHSLTEKEKWTDFEVVIVDSYFLSYSGQNETSTTSLLDSSRFAIVYDSFHAQIHVQQTE